MKKFIFKATAAIAAIAAMSGTSYAQSGKLQFNPEPSDNRPFGISVGLVTKQLSDGQNKMPWMFMEQLAEGELGNKKSSPSFQIGFSWSPEFRYGIGIQTGVYYELSVDNLSVSENIGGYDLSTSCKLDEHTLSIPLRVQWRYEIINDLSIFLYTGPSFDIGLAYNVNMSANIPSVGSQDNIKVDAYKESDLNRFNMTWGVGAGIRWKFLQLNLGSDWGLTSIMEGTKLNKPFHVTLSYRF